MHYLLLYNFMGLDLQALTAAQDTCEDTQSYRTAITGMTVPDDGGSSLLWDTSSSKPRLIVLPGYRRYVFDLLHGLSHPSSRACKHLIRVAWDGKGHHTLCSEHSSTSSTVY